MTSLLQYCVYSLKAKVTSAWLVAWKVLLGFCHGASQVHAASALALHRFACAVSQLRPCSAASMPAVLFDIVSWTVALLF